MADITTDSDNTVAVSGSRATVTAGETIDPSMPVYRDTSDSNKYKKSQADALATSGCDGVALCHAANGQPLIILRNGGVIDIAPEDLPIGGAYVVSAATAGKICPIEDIQGGEYVTLLGISRVQDTITLAIDVSGVAKAEET